MVFPLNECGDGLPNCKHAEMPSHIDRKHDSKTKIPDKIVFR